jgi:HAD superfamily hydrolase (TIGR01509 family)
VKSDRRVARRAGSAGAPGALLIDGLGTLVSLAPPAPVLRRELAARFGMQVTESQAAAGLSAEIAYYRAHMALGRDADSLAGLRRRCAEVLRDALPANERLARSDGGELTDVLLSSLRFDAYPDARGALARARRAGARVVVVSNWDVSLHDVLELVGLAPLLDGVVTSAAIGAAKPAPEIFRHALALADVTPDHAVHVGDSPSEDVAGALACGIRPVLLRRDGGPAAGDGVQVITSLSELDWP